MISDAGIERVLQIHTRYRQAGGEDQVVAAERQLLEEAGIQVRQLLFDNADLHEGQSLTADVRLAASAVWSRSAFRRVRAAVAEHRPQVAHVHNTFSAASPAVHAAAASAGVAVVHTLHNYRLVCPVATAFRDGHVCTDCFGMPFHAPAVVHRCVRSSRAQSFVVAATNALHRGRGTFHRDISRYIALTEFQRQRMIDGGLPGSRIEVLPNFLGGDPELGPPSREGFLYVGRLSVEKGLATLLRAAAAAPGLISVAGDGPQAGSVEQSALKGHVRYLGHLSRAAVADHIRAAAAVVLPSVWFEGFPIVLLEAYASGTPVIASRIGSLEELVDDGETGFLVEPGDAPQLADRMTWAVQHPTAMRQMGANARQRYERRYHASTHLSGLIGIYTAARAADPRGHAA